MIANTQTNRNSTFETRGLPYARAFGYTKSSRRVRTYSKDMKEEREHADSSLSETMVARIEINELGDVARQKEITDSVEALDGVIGIKIENEALHVSYDPLATTEKKIEQAICSTGATIKTAATDTEGAHPDLPTSASGKPAVAKKSHNV